MAKRRKTAPVAAHLTQHHRAVITWLRERGAQDISAIQRTRHVQVRFSWLGTAQATTLSVTPGNERSAGLSAIKQLRHQLGLVGERG